MSVQALSRAPSGRATPPLLLWRLAALIVRTGWLADLNGATARSLLPGWQLAAVFVALVRLRLRRMRCPPA